MKLYFSSHCCSLTPHIVLQELGLPYDLVRVDIRTKRTSDGRDFLTVNPKGYVAALELSSGDIITECPAIVQYLADLSPSAKLAPAAGTLGRVRLQEWLSYISGELHASLGPLFNPALPEAARDIFTAKVAARLAVVEAALAADGREYLLGDDVGFTVADAFLFVILGWLPLFKIDLAAWPRTAALARRVEARPSVAAALAREAEAPEVK